jgi:glycosyltransferase involved in cell wall biosynthesis
VSDYASVGLLSYNRPAFLQDAISSIHEHASAPFELIVHDDGSSDQQVYDVLMAEYTAGRISTLILNPPGHNQGVGTAINRMFKLGSGDPLIKLDQDLLMGPGWLARTQEILAENRQYSRDYKQRTGNTPKAQPRIGMLGLLHYHHDPVASMKCKLKDHGHTKMWQEHTHILGSAFALTRDAWRKFGPLAEHSAAFAEDWERMRQITAEDDWCCGLPPEDLCTNRGFGIGPSTVVVAEGTVATIHNEPRIFWQP